MNSTSYKTAQMLWFSAPSSGNKPKLQVDETNSTKTSS